jgi:hypothetical protein
MLRECKIDVFWVVTPYTDVEYQCFGGRGCLHVQGEVNGAREVDTDLEQGA